MNATGTPPHLMPSLAPCLVLACLLAGHALGQGASIDDRRNLIEQKLRLVEMLVSTQASKALLSGTPPSERLERGSQALIRARQAMHDNRLEEAGRILDAALRSGTAPQNAVSPASLSRDALRQQYQNLVEQVATYRGAIEDISTRERDAATARDLLAAIDRRSVEARQLVVADQMEAASRILADSYRHAIAGLARLRAGEEVVQTLNFDSPADEFAYEVRRYESTQMLVGVLIRDGRAGSDQRLLIDQYIDDARREHDTAVGLARPDGKYREAIHYMERAVERLNRALQAMGLPVQ